MGLSLLLLTFFYTELDGMSSYHSALKRVWSAPAFAPPRADRDGFAVIFGCEFAAELLVVLANEHGDHGGVRVHPFKHQQTAIVHAEPPAIVIHHGNRRDTLDGRGAKT